jgi:hypothetical protein
MIESVIFRLS